MIEPTDPRNLSTSKSIMLTALRRLAILWTCLFVVVTLLVLWLAKDLLPQSTFIALASGLISTVALLPSGRAGDSTDDWVTTGAKRLTTILIAMAIRVTGTVALFLFCRYQMGLPPRTIALLVCGWYVLLTSLEVSLLAHGAKSLTTSTESTSE